MRKITLLIAMAFASFQASAQIAPNSVAPDFTATDINGNVHHLADYLAAGKTVIIDVSATWCAPCWNYHNTQALDDLYEAYGPEGSNEVVVLFVEGDNATTLADLNGTTAATQGNWVATSPYPIIDSAAIANLYQITYFPTIFRICPDGIVSEVGSLTANSLRSTINTNCGALTGVQNNAHAVTNDNAFCTANGAISAKVKNFGENILTAATLKLKENGEVIATKAYTGTINRFATKVIPFDEIAVNPASTYSFELSDVNNAPLYTTNYNNAPLGVAVAAPVTSADVVVKVYTDNYPTEISWKIKNGNVVIAQGGPYSGSANGGGVNANTTISQTVTLPADGCFSVVLSDAYGDGWGLGNTPHGLEIFEGDQSIFNVSVANFGLTLTKPNVMTNTVLGLNHVQATKFGIYPNPTSGIFNIITENPVQVSVVDVLGKVIYNSKNVTSQTSIDLSGFEKGIYLAKITGENATSTEKIILN